MLTMSSIVAFIGRVSSWVDEWFNHYNTEAGNYFSVWGYYNRLFQRGQENGSDTTGNSNDTRQIGLRNRSYIVGDYNKAYQYGNDNVHTVFKGPEDTRKVNSTGAEIFADEIVSHLDESETTSKTLDEGHEEKLREIESLTSSGASTS
ncbi:hypothetical protein GGR51DRAFT_500800 [Nemania sp. FL0031]|nr:hypothetical protein GGR51DRAFT_500800 [Nemania sp. FL0031]